LGGLVHPKSDAIEPTAEAPIDVALAKTPIPGMELKGRVTAATVLAMLEMGFLAYSSALLAVAAFHI
jgi:hypothetical protein